MGSPTTWSGPFGCGQCTDSIPIAAISAILAVNTYTVTASTLTFLDGYLSCMPLALPLFRPGKAMQLWTHGVGVVVTLTAVVINGPKHRADHSRVPGRVAQLVRGAWGCGAGDDVVHRLHDNGRRGIRR